MANTFVTPEWVVREFNREYREYWWTGSQSGEYWWTGSQSGEVWYDAGDPLFPFEPLTDAPACNLTFKEAALLGAAAVVASPRKIARRGFLGLAWKPR